MVQYPWSFYRDVTIQQLLTRARVPIPDLMQEPEDDTLNRQQKWWGHLRRLANSVKDVMPEGFQWPRTLMGCLNFGVEYLLGRDKLCSFFEALNDYAFSKIIHLYQENNDLKEYVRYLERELIKKDKLAKMH
ncbi:hypothetical protein O0I10_005726 [Lichtheimia ornata]|uniref:Uncharacterized protein n=1 Tax=Lichtheimia ornata TaxID=688661 RepID=A0AAD7XZH9_9FUNG|nr:uncharacterized protein O0I10_005726 [Lichtheimia ornata]KAJ8658686.1 hypothetical protein O0I10_005726 [Lichtheimia ornata]